MLTCIFKVEMQLLLLGEIYELDLRYLKSAKKETQWTFQDN